MLSQSILGLQFLRSLSSWLSCLVRTGQKWLPTRQRKCEDRGDCGLCAARNTGAQVTTRLLPELLANLIDSTFSLGVLLDAQSLTVPSSDHHGHQGQLFNPLSDIRRPKPRSISK